MRNRNTRSTTGSTRDREATIGMRDAARAANGRGGVKAAATTCAVLSGLAALGGRASLAALAAHLGAHPSTLHRYLKSLAAAGLVVRDPLTTAYALGAEAIALGLAAMRQSDPIRAADAALVRLRDELGATAFLAVPGNRGPTIVRLEEPAEPVVVNVRPGFVLSVLWSATGRCLLAASRDARLHAIAREELAAAPPRRRSLLPETEPIATLCQEIRSAGGIATVRDLYLVGVSAAAAPIFDFTGAVKAVLTVLGPTDAFDVSPSGPVVAALRAEAEAVSARLGHRVSEPTPLPVEPGGSTAARSAPTAPPDRRPKAANPQPK